jgi:post-segregation antitoxin (ccd killing protein)
MVVKDGSKQVAVVVPIELLNWARDEALNLSKVLQNALNAKREQIGLSKIVNG